MKGSRSSYGGLVSPTIAAFLAELTRQSALLAVM
jgi:hypothetical protein